MGITSLDTYKRGSEVIYEIKESIHSEYTKMDARVSSGMPIKRPSIEAASYLMITDLGSSAEMIRRGNIEGFSLGSNAIFENPASLHKVNVLSTSVFSSQIMKEVNYRNVSIAFNSDIGVFGFGYMDAGVMYCLHPSSLLKL